MFAAKNGRAESDLRSGRPLWRRNDIVIANGQNLVIADQKLILKEVPEEQ